MIREVVLHSGHVIADLDDSDSCGSYPPCGGCDDCLLRHYTFYGFTIREKLEMKKKELDWNEVGF